MSENKKPYYWKIFNKEGIQLNEEEYLFIWSEKGQSFASKHANGQGNSFGPIGCLLDKNGQEITEHVFRSLVVRECLFDKNKKFLYLYKEGKCGVFHPDGQEILHNKDINLRLIKGYQQSNDKDTFWRKLSEEYQNNTIVASFSKDGKSYYLCYNGEIIEKK